MPARLDVGLEGSRRWALVTSGEVLARKRFLLRNRMSELFTYGSVGGAGYDLGAMAPGESPLLPGRVTRYACPSSRSFCEEPFSWKFDLQQLVRVELGVPYP